MEVSGDPEERASGDPGDRDCEREVSEDRRGPRRGLRCRRAGRVAPDLDQILAPVRDLVRRGDPGLALDLSDVDVTALRGAVFFFLPEFSSGRLIVITVQ